MIEESCVILYFDNSDVINHYNCIVDLFEIKCDEKKNDLDSSSLFKISNTFV